MNKVQKLDFLKSINELNKTHLSHILDLDLGEIKEILKSSYKDPNNDLKEQFHKDMENIQKMKMILKEKENAFEEFKKNPEYKEILEKILANSGLLQ